MCVVVDAVSGLGQARLMPSGLHAQERDLKHEQHLLSLLNGVSLDASLVRIIRKQARSLLQGACVLCSDTCCRNCANVPANYTYHVHIELVSRQQNCDFRSCCVSIHRWSCIGFG